MNKAHRRWTASLLALVLVCLQFWTAAYACPAPAGAGTVPAATMAGMPDCAQGAGMDTKQPQLCKAHCDRDKQTVNNLPASDLAPAAALLDELFTRLALWLPVQAAEALPAVVAAHSGPPDGSPPVYLALQVLRH